MISGFLPAKHGMSRRETDKALQVSPADASIIEQVGIAGAFAKDFISWVGMPERYGTPRWNYGTFVISLRLPRRAA